MVLEIQDAKQCYEVLASWNRSYIDINLRYDF
jgi:hypothetical protein